MCVWRASRRQRTFQREPAVVMCGDKKRYGTQDHHQHQHDGRCQLTRTYSARRGNFDKPRRQAEAPPSVTQTQSSSANYLRATPALPATSARCDLDVVHHIFALHHFLCYHCVVQHFASRLELCSLAKVRQRIVLPSNYELQLPIPIASDYLHRVLAAVFYRQNLHWNLHWIFRQRVCVTHARVLSA